MNIRLNISPRAIDPQKKAAMAWLRKAILDDALDESWNDHEVLVPAYSLTNPDRHPVAFYYSDNVPGMNYSETFTFNSAGDVFSSEAGDGVVVLNFNEAS